jgi:hypothetical protein
MVWRVAGVRMLDLDAGIRCDKRGWTGTLFRDVLDFDGVGFAIEPEDLIVWGHCGRFTIHRGERDGTG